MVKASASYLSSVRLGAKRFRTFDPPRQLNTKTYDVCLQEPQEFERRQFFSLARKVRSCPRLPRKASAKKPGV